MADSSPIGIAKLSAGWAIALSVLLILAGILAIVVPPVAGIGVTILIAWLLLLGGVRAPGHCLAYPSNRRHVLGASCWPALPGIAIYMLVWPIAGLASLTLLLAGYLFAKGIMVLILAYRIRRHSGSGWLFFDGVIALILGAMIGLSWPWSSEWAIGTLIGISMLFAGFTRLPMAMAARRLLTKPA